MGVRGAGEPKSINPPGEGVGGEGRVWGVEVALQDDMLMMEMGFSKLFTNEVAKKFLGGKAFDPGGSRATLEGLNTGMEGACASTWARGKVVGVDEADGYMRGAEGEAIDQAKVHGICVDVFDIGRPARGD